MIDKKNNGFSLLEVLVAAAIMGILAMVLARMSDAQNRMLRKAQLDQDLLAVSKMFGQRFSCSADSCAHLLIKLDEFAIGRWVFKGVCDDEDLYVKTRKLRRQDDRPIQHPLTRKPMPWKDLFKVDQGFYCTVHPPTSSLNPSNPNSNFQRTSLELLLDRELSPEEVKEVERRVREQLKHILE